MRVTVKDFGIGMEVKNKGMELEVRDGGRHLGDIVLTKSGLIWCKGRTTRARSKRLTWKKFAEYMERPTTRKKATRRRRRRTRTN